MSLSCNQTLFHEVTEVLGRPPRVLDLFSGLEGWSEPWKKIGAEVFTVDINPKFKPSLTADISRLTPSDLPWKPDVLTASPPCEDLAGRFTDSMRKVAVRPPADLTLSKATWELIKATGARVWIVENVRASLRPLSEIFGPLTGRTLNHPPPGPWNRYVRGPWYIHYLWSNVIPEGVVDTAARPWTLPISMRPKCSYSSSAAALRARIPRELAEGFLISALRVLKD